MLSLTPLKHTTRMPAGAQVRAWLATPAGQALLQCERPLLQAQLERHFGSFALFYNPLEEHAYNSPLRHRVTLGQPGWGAELECAENYWPVMPDQLDTVVLQHSLDFSASPYDLLREAARSVRPGGHLVILGLNPLSPVARHYRIFNATWRHAHLLSARRLSEWLAVLGFSLEKRHFACYTPLRMGATLGGLERCLRQRQWPIGACYVLVARKQVHAALTPEKRNIRLRALLPLPLAHHTSESRRAKEKKINE